jgi:2-polyprenyl-3-methyl-5-hydroxy-6-metoxy-1,4-benzoquinol methylase
MKHFHKYEEWGAYHWTQGDPKLWRSEFNPLLAARYRITVGEIPRRARSVLDIGCGDGYLLYLVSCRYPEMRLYGIDDNALAIELGKKYLMEYKVRSEIKEASAYAAPFGDSCFDVVLMADVIEHLEEAESALKEAGRVLHDEGMLVLSTPNAQPERQWDACHCHEYSIPEIMDLCNRHFRKVDVIGCWPMWWVRQWLAGGKRKTAINMLTRFVYNPFAGKSSRPSAKHGQLIVKCAI